MTVHPELAHAPWLKAPEIQAVFAAIAAGGFGARCVGGAVRNTLLRHPVSDVDVATQARPEDVARLAVAAGLSVHETGLDHGTVTVVSSGHPVEVTTLRRDVGTDGRHATVAFTSDWAVDAARRDFTINALYCDADGTLHDPLGGLPDIAAGRVRFIGDPTARIREDYLRILRFFRFSAVYAEGGLDPHGLAAVTAEQAGLVRISAERVRSELLKILVAPHVVAIAEAMRATGILTRVLAMEPDVAALAKTGTMEAHLALPANAMRRLFALTRHGTASPAGNPTVGDAVDNIIDLARRLRLSNTEKRRLTAMTQAASLDVSTPRAIRAALYRHGVERVTDSAVEQATRADASQIARNVLAIAGNWTRPVLPVTGADLLASGFEPGPQLGTTLARLEEAWVASDFRLTADDLLSSLEP